MFIGHYGVSFAAKRWGDAAVARLVVPRGVNAASAQELMRSV
jgi:hypothetical protein